MRNFSLVIAVAMISAAWSFAEMPPRRTITGTENGHYTNGIVPVDLSNVPVVAWVPNGTEYTKISGTGTSSGTFKIENVPDEYYLLQLGSTYLWTGNSVVDADYFAAYRSDVVYADYPNTLLTFDLTNLEGWQSTDMFEMACPNNDSFLFFPGTVGETTFTGTFNYGPSNANLSNAAEGDQYFLTQLSTQLVGGLPFTALSRWLAPPKFTQAQNSNTAINGTLATYAQTNTFEANINGADLLAQAMASNPNAILYAWQIGLEPSPGNFSHGQTGSLPDFVIYNGPPITTNGDLGPVFYGNPYPSSQWTAVADYGYFASTSYTAPGATNSSSLGAATYVTTTNLPSASNPMKPLVGVPQNPLINGQNFFDDNQTGVGLTPALQWSAPAVGIPTYYLVGVFQLNNFQGYTQIIPVATLRTQETGVRIPPNVLSAGQAYVFSVSARYIPGLNFSKTPFSLGPTTAYSEILSGMITP